MQTYSRITASEGIPCSKSIFNSLKKLLEMNSDSHGFEVEYKELDKKIFIFAEEQGNESELPLPFLDLFGKLLKKANRKYLEFGTAYYGYRPCTGTTGGGRFRIHSDGSIEWKESYWASETNYKVSLTDIVNSFETEGCEGCGTVPISEINKARVSLRMQTLQDVSS